MGVEVIPRRDPVVEHLFERLQRTPPHRQAQPPTTPTATIRFTTHRGAPSTLRPMSEHPSITRFREALEQIEGRPVADGRIVVLPDSVHTAQLAAEALGCE